MKMSDLTHLVDGVSELARAMAIKSDDEDNGQLLFCGVQTALTSKESAKDDDIP